MDRLKTAISQNLSQIRAAIAQVCCDCQRSPSEIELVAVSKMQPVESMCALFELGHVTFGESYAQELEKKSGLLQNVNLQFSFIGHLQSNKIGKIVRCASEIQSVPSLKYAEIIAKYAEQYNKTPYPIYLSINSAGEIAKSGIDLSKAISLAEQIQTQLPMLRVRGIMTVPPSSIQDPNEGEPLVVPDLYQELKEVSLMIGEKKLSLGMSGDLRTAIAAGSTCIRIGSALFGDRRLNTEQG